VSDPPDRHDDIEAILRAEAPQVLGALVRRYGHFDLAEDAVQDALLAASRHWPDGGVPDRPRAWLIRAGSRALVDRLRSDRARERRERRTAAALPADQLVSVPADVPRDVDRDDSLLVLFLCCHPALTPASAIALTLRAVGGLRTDEIARAFLVPDKTIGQRISRAKATVRAEPLEPSGDDLPPRLAAVLRVLYLIFNEGYVASSGEALVRTDLSAEAIRLARLLHRSLPEDGEVAGLLALMLLTDARRGARVAGDGSAVPIADQDRSAWDKALIEEGAALVTRAMASAPLGRFQIQAAIAALHDEAATAEDTDWPQILGLYTLLERFDPSPMVPLNRAVAEAMVHGPERGLRTLDGLEADGRLAGHHRLHAVRGHLLDQAGRPGEAAASYQAAAAATLSTPEQRYLRQRAATARERSRSGGR
jgi:RNA polymerase sigma factor (sigma-70 family)